MPKTWLSVLGILALFIGTSYLASSYRDELHSLVRSYPLFGPVSYVLIEIAGVIAAPVSTLALIPLGVALWGSFWTGVLSLVGWTLGSLLAFELARTYGQPLLTRFLNLKDLKAMERYLPQGNLFWGVVGLRLLIPVDLVSYALGLFTPIDRWRYSLATVLGYLPSAFAYSYAATASLGYQVVLGALVVIVALALRLR
jgi:uncharacterized membrane protein YdjX (TVP38/TMEM64 family)